MHRAITASGDHMWTSGAMALRRRRHRLVALSLTVGLLAVATTLTAASAHGLVRLPIGLPGSGPASVDAGPGVDQVGPLLPLPEEVSDEPAEAEREVAPEAGEEASIPSGTPDGDADEEDASSDDDARSSDDEAPSDDRSTSDEAASTEAGSDQPPEPDDLAVVQARLRELGYLIGPVDGTKGQQTVAAVMAFQRVNGLQVDGVVGPQTRDALEDPAGAPELRGGPENRIEVDLDRQILHLVEGGQRIVTLKVSSGNGEAYGTGSGGTALARTPIGEFTVERRIHGVREAALGTLYDPLYFHRGFAIHGAPSVPAGPASHGCVRVARADATWLIQRVPDGMPVHLHGGSHVFSPS